MQTPNQQLFPDPWVSLWPVSVSLYTPALLFPGVRGGWSPKSCSEVANAFVSPLIISRDTKLLAEGGSWFLAAEGMAGWPARLGTKRFFSPSEFMQRLPNSGDGTFLSIPVLLRSSSHLSQQEWWLRVLHWNLFRGKASLIYYGQSETRRERGSFLLVR